MAKNKEIIIMMVDMFNLDIQEKLKKEGFVQMGPRSILEKYCVDVFSQWGRDDLVFVKEKEESNE